MVLKSHVHPHHLWNLFQTLIPALTLPQILIQEIWARSQEYAFLADNVRVGFEPQSEKSLPGSHAIPMEPILKTTHLDSLPPHFIQGKLRLKERERAWSKVSQGSESRTLGSQPQLFLRAPDSGGLWLGFLAKDRVQEDQCGYRDWQT